MVAGHASVRTISLSRFSLIYHRLHPTLFFVTIVRYVRNFVKRHRPNDPIRENRHTVQSVVHVRGANHSMHCKTRVNRALKRANVAVSSHRDEIDVSFHLRRIVRQGTPLSR